MALKNTNATEEVYKPMMTLLVSSEASDNGAHLLVVYAVCGVHFPVFVLRTALNVEFACMSLPEPSNQQPFKEVQLHIDIGNVIWSQKWAFFSSRGSELRMHVEASISHPTSC